MLKIISAGAGSGKTYTLTKQMTELLLPNPDTGVPAVRASGILATTFTNKAAAELKERVRVKLLEEGLSEQADELENALIGTVHSIGVKLLKRFAFEAGISPAVDILADDDQQMLFNQSLATVLSLDKVQEMNELAEVLGFYKSAAYPHDWRKDLKYMLDAARANALSTPDLEASKQYSLNTFFELLPEANTSASAEWFSTNLIKILEETLDILEHNEDTTKSKQEMMNVLRGILNTARMRDILPWYEWVRIHKECAGAPKKSREDVEDLQLFAQKHNTHPLFQEHIRRFMTNMFDLSIAALEEYDRYKKSRGLIDYIDMEVLILKLIEDQDVREVLGEELDLLLVDEFQDTNPIQLKIFLELTKIAKQAIWVGDPKQSIYGFRGAAPELMKAIVDSVGEQNIQVLGESWRSREDLVNMVNGLFAEAFKNEMPVERIALQTPDKFLKANESKQLALACHHWNFKHEANRQPKQPWFEQCIARTITDWLGRGMHVRIKGTNDVRPMRGGDIAVLCRSNKQCQSVAEQLIKEGLKASIAQSGLLQTREASLLLACLKFTLDKDDSLSIAEILLLAAHQTMDEIIDDRLKYMESLAELTDHNKNTKRWGNDNPYIQTLNSLRKQVRELSASEILNLIIEKLHIRHIVAAWSGKERRLANLDMMRSFALQYEETCTRLHSAATLGGFLLWLDQLAKMQRDDQGKGGDEDTIQVMTYHASKGLEWAVVICHSLDNQLQEPIFGVRMVQVSETVDIDNPLAGRLLCYWVNPYSDQHKNTDLMAEIELTDAKKKIRQNSLQEEARLMYVGLTRARDYLVLPTTPKKATLWLNRVYHHGQENTPSLDGYSPVFHWIWKGNEIPLQIEDFMYPQNFEYGAPPMPDIHYLPLPAGEKEHPLAQLTQPKELFEKLEVEVHLPAQYTIPYVLPNDTEFRHEYTDVAAVFNLFLLGDNLDKPEKVRLHRAESLLLHHNLQDWIEPNVLLENAQIFYTYLENIAQPKHLQKHRPFRLTRNEQTFKGVLDMWVETAEDEIWLIRSATVQVLDFFKRKAKIAEEGYFLQAARQALIKENQGLVVRTFVVFALEGQLYELVVKQPKPQDTLF